MRNRQPRVFRLTGRHHWCYSRGLGRLSLHRGRCVTKGSSRRFGWGCHLGCLVGLRSILPLGHQGCGSRLALLSRSLLLHRHQIANVFQLPLLQLLNAAPEGNDWAVQLPTVQSSDLHQPLLLSLLLGCLPSVETLRVPLLHESSFR